MRESLGSVEFLSVLTACIGIVIAEQAPAADVSIPGKLSVVRPGKSFKFVSKGSFTIPAGGSADDPTLHGATLRIFDSNGAGGAGEVVFDLDATGWKGLGNPARSRGYRYRGRDDLQDSDPRGTCRAVVIQDDTIKAVCKGSAVDLAPPFAGSQAVVLETGALRYCAELGGTTLRNNERLFRRKNAPPPEGCVGTPPPTPTATSTPTATPTPELSQLQCDLDDTQSRLLLQLQAAAVVIRPSGTIVVDCGNTDGNGVAPCTCELDSIAPINLLGIGDVCFASAGPCAGGAAYCDGGFAADIALRGDHNIDITCTSQASCASQCEAHCAGLGPGFARMASSCEGYCEGGSNADGVCGLDSECPGGNCPGRDLAQGGPHAQVCQCTCTGNGLGAVAPAGTLECNLGMQITIERDMDQVCGNSTPSIVLPPLCGPLTTAFADAFTLNANNEPFADDRLPPYPNGQPCPDCLLEATGSAGTCGGYAAGDLSDLRLVGYLQFYDSTLGDILTEQQFVCQ